MMTLILTAMLTSVSQPVPTTAQYQPCVWPNRCSSVAAATAQFQPCVWPNKCG